MKILRNGWNSLGTRLTAWFAALVLAVTVAVSLYSYLSAKSALEENLRANGRMLAAAMASNAGGYLARGDSSYLHGYVRDMTAKGLGVACAAFADKHGNVIAHSDASLEGRKWRDLGLPAVTRPDTVFEQDVVRDGMRLRELVSPVLSGREIVGAVQLGIGYDRVNAGLRRLALGIGVAGFVVLGMAVAGVRTFTAKVASSLTRLVSNTRQISEGELRTTVPEEGYDEIRDLARSFNTMGEKLRSILRQIQATSATVGESSSNILLTIQEHATGATQQAASVSEVTATMEELSRTSHQIADNALAVKNSAAQTVEMAQQGTVLIRESVGAMEQIKDRVADIAKRNLFLGEKSHEIGKVMDIIKEIASEIHLLALNAAIESAAAGEHGRRFSVVASEVRRLAEKTRESTETIRSIITEIQSATSSSIQATEQGTREVDRWRETVTLSSDAFGEIIQMIEKTLEASTQISLATHQQTSANEQVVQAMRQIAEMVRTAAANMRGSSSAVGELKEMAGKLNEITLVFMV